MSAALLPSGSRRFFAGRAIASAALALLGVVVLGATVVVGFTFLGLAIAMPIALPIAEAYGLPVNAADAALAQQLAGFWWVFAGLALATFVAGVALVVVMIRLLSPVPRD